MVQVIEEGSEVILEIELPEGMFGMETEQVTTQKLGITRLTEERYENPDGSSLVLDCDLTGAERGQCPTAGPLERLHAGKNRVVVWRR